MTEAGKLTRFVGMRTEFNTVDMRYELVEYRAPLVKGNRPDRAIHGWLDAAAADVACRAPGGLERALEILWAEIVGEHINRENVRKILTSCRHDYNPATEVATEQRRQT